MRRRGPIGLIIIVVLSLSAITIANASAEETKWLPEGSSTSPVTFTGKSGGATLSGLGPFAVVGCPSDQTKASAISANLGTFDVLFLGCANASAESCTGLMDTVSGSVLFLGTFHFWLALKSEKLISVFVYLMAEAHLECGTTLVLVRGCVAGQVSPTEVLTSKVTVKLATSGTRGHNEITSVLPEGATKEIECKLEIKEGSGAFGQGALVAEEEYLGFKQGGVSVTVLLMK